MSKKIKWNDSFMQFCFTCTKTTEGLQKSISKNVIQSRTSDLNSNIFDQDIKASSFKISPNWTKQMTLKITVN